MVDDENAVSDSESSICPYCRETIHPQATRCKHCQTWLTTEEKGAGEFKTTRGPWTVRDIGPADEGTVAPLTEKSCGDCHSSSGFWGRLGGLVSGSGVRTCKIRHCYIADGRIYCIDIPFTEDCELPSLIDRLLGA
jgi:hypothetical protein